MNVRDLKIKKTKLLSQARALQATADAANRAMTQEEVNQFDGLMDEVNNLTADIQRREQLEQLESEISEPEGRGLLPELDEEDDEERDGLTDEELRGLSPRLQQALRANAAEDDAFAHRTSPQYAGNFRKFLLGMRLPEINREPSRRDRRAIQMDSDPMGGYLQAPPQFVARLIQAVDDVLYFRQPGWATVLPVASSEAFAASLDADPADAEWTTEIGTIGYDTTMVFGQRKLEPHVLAKGIKVSRKTLRVAPQAEEIVIARMQRKLLVPMESAYMTGDGALQPLGVFTASNDGIPTTRDVSTGNTITTVEFDGLIEAKYTLKTQYWPTAKWVFHRDVMKQVAKLQDDNGQYIWRESVRAGEPDRVIGLPNFMSEYAPNTMTTGQYVGILGDFSYYWIADAMDMEMQRLLELYSTTRQIGLHFWLETDGMPVLSEAFVRVKLA